MDSNTPPKNTGSAVIGITLGDINGIGPEVIIKALSDSRLVKQFKAVVYGSTKTLSYYKKYLNLDDFTYTTLRSEDQPSANTVNVVNCWEEAVDIKVGESTEVAGKCSRLALERASEDLESGRIQALVTGPINKFNIQSEDFKFSGHTEFLASRFSAKDDQNGNGVAQDDRVAMVMVSGDFRVAVLTGHIPLSEVSARITRELIRSKIGILNDSLIKDFGIAKPRIAVLGLNPHAGEEGLLGTEEDEIIDPEIKELKNRGQLVYGPFPADGFFGSNQYLKYDAILAMYHDQGLIPFKSLSFSRGVNFTAGIDVVRTSPDHGTAFSIAGKNVANEQSIREAIYLALDILKNRKELVPEEK